jgi:transketolase
MPSRELFERQDDAYRESVLLPDVMARISVEEGSVIGWGRYVGIADIGSGVRTFGLSAPIRDLLTKFGFTSDKVLDAAKQHLAQVKEKPA